MGGMRGAMMGGRRMGMRDLAAAGKVWAFNGVAGMPEAPLLEAARGETVRLTMVNDTAWPHAMHLHGHHFRVLGEGGMPVAMLDMARYDSFEFEMAPGDRLILYSDGVTECRSTGGEQFGMERFKSFLLDRRALDNPALLDALRNELAHFSGGKAPDDDLSVLCVERLALDD